MATARLVGRRRSAVLLVGAGYALPLLALSQFRPEGDLVVALETELNDDLLYHGDVNAALRRMLQSGFDVDGERVQGLREMLDKLRGTVTALDRVGQVAQQGPLEEPPLVLGVVGDAGHHVRPAEPLGVLERARGHAAAGLEIDRDQAKAMGIPLQSIFDTLAAYMGSTYVNDFNLFGRIYKVKVQAEPPFRAEADQIRRLEIRDANGSWQKK